MFKDVRIFIAVSFFGISGIIEAFYNSSDSFIPSLWEIVMFFACLFAVVYSLFYLVTKKEREKPFPLPVLMILIYSVTIILVGLWRSNYFKTVFLKVCHNEDLGGMSITFFEDRTYEVDINGLFSNEYYRGTYTMEGDTIVFDRKICFSENDFLEKKMLIDQNIIYQLDSNKQIRQNEIDFRIINDRTQ